MFAIGKFLKMKINFRSMYPHNARELIDVYIDYTINNIDLDGFDKILNEYVSYHNKKFTSYNLKLTCELKFNNNFIQTRETIYHSYSELNNLKS